MIRLIIPMSGEGKRFREAGYSQLKPLIPVRGKPIIEHLLDRFPAAWPKTFICNEEHLRSEPALRRTLEHLAPGCRIVAIPPHKKGPVWAVLEAARIDPGSVPENEPCLVNYCDFSFSWGEDARAFERFVASTGCDGAILCYTGFHPEYLRPTLYAYCREEKGRVVEVREKGHFTPDRTREYASSGSYYFKSGRLVRKHFQGLMERGPLLNGEGYISLVYNELIQDGGDVRVYEIPWFLQWGTPQDLRDYEYWAGVFERYPRGRGGALPPNAGGARGLQLLMPMAGRGSRFSGPGSPQPLPKPLQPVLGKPMFLAALDHLPAAAKRVVVVLREHAAAVRAAASDVEIVEIEGVTEGQAITTELGARALDPSLPVLVSSCDHGMVWDPQRWESILRDRPDVVVWGQRGYPGADRTPKAFAYIAADGERIRRVSVKEPISPDPRQDLLLVGTFWFRNPALMVEAIAELKRRNIRVNNELYLDSVINLCVEKGWDARVFEADGYLCWGTPEALQEFNYWHAYFTGAPRAAG